MAVQPSPSPAAPETPVVPASPARGPGLRAWIVLGVLCLVYVLNFLDRQLLGILAKPIQDSLHISDGQLGRITGLYFALFYCFIALPVGWLADKTNRVRVLALACAIWSAATMACGLARTYPELVTARMTVGVGEAGGVPPSYAIITDYFPPRQRGTALAMYNLGPPIGQALGVAFGASIAMAYSWRDAFVTLGSVGLLAALLVLALVREPRRGGQDQARGQARPAAAVAQRSGFWTTVKAFFSRPEFVLVSLGSGATQFITYGAGNFTTLFLMREKGMTLGEVALWLALLVGIATSAGIFISGRVIDRFVHRSKAAYALIPAAALALAAPFFVGFVWAPSWPLALLFLIGPNLFNYFYLSSAVALVQQEAAPDQRVLSGALLLLIMNMIGLGLGPTYVGAASDAFRAAHPHHSLQMAFYTLAPFYGVAIIIFLWLARILARRAALTAGAAAR